MTYRLIDTAEGLVEAAHSLAHGTRLYLDTEFESNRLGTRLCLLQISAGKEVFLIDTIKLGSLDALRRCLGNPDVEWVLHAGNQDVPLITQRLQVTPPALLFDTQVAWALLTAENCVSLAYLQFRLLGVRGSKAHQADDWLRRPLAESQLRYASTDVEHLPEMARVLRERAAHKQRLAVVYAASHESLTPPLEAAPALRVESFRNAWQLEAQSQAGLRALILWFNSLPANEKRDAPDTKTLLSIASRLPDTLDALGRIKGVQRHFIQKYGKKIIAVMTDAARRAQASDYTPIDPPPYATFAEAKLDAWLGTLRAEVCSELEVSPEFVLPARILKDLKAQLADGGSLDPEPALAGFRKDLLSALIADFCRRSPPPV